MIYTFEDLHLSHLKRCFFWAVISMNRRKSSNTEWT